MMIKRVLSLILSLVMVLGMMPVNIAATADEIPTEDLSVPETTAPTLEESIPVETAEAFETDIPVVSEEEIAAVSTDTVMTQEELVSAIQSAYNNGESQYILTEAVEINSDCTISDADWDRYFHISTGEGGILTVKEGAAFALTFGMIPGEAKYGSFGIDGGEVIVESGAAFTGQLSISSGAMRVNAGGTLNAGYTWMNGGSLIAESGANITGSFMIQTSACFISGIDASLIEANFKVNSNEEFEKVLSDSGKYGSMHISAGDVAITKNMTVAENVTIYWRGNLSVSAGATLTNYGTINTYSGTISVEETGAIANHGLLTCKENGLSNYGTISGNAILYVNTDGELCITTYEQLKLLENCGGLSATPTVSAPITLANNVSYGGWANIAENGELIVPEGVTLTVPGILFVYGKITVKAGGTLALNPGYDQCIQLYGSITVEEGGDIVNISQYQDEPGIMLLGDHAETHGVPGEFLIASATTTEEFEALLEQGVARIFIEGNVEMNNHYTQILDQEVVVLSGGTLTINNRVLFQGEKAKLIVYYGGVLIVNRYDLSFFSNGSLTVEEGGKLYNNHTINIGTTGVTDIKSGAAVVNENARFYIWEKGALNIEAGASFDNSKGFIHVSSEGGINDPAGILTNNGFIDDGIIDNSGWTAGGSCGDSLNWSIANKTLTISGSGRMYDYDGYFDGRNGPMPPWSDYNSIIDFLVIEPGITHIGNMAFADVSMSTVVIPEGVTSIGNWAFWSCDELMSVVIPDDVVSLGESAFHECYKLKEINLPDSLQTIGAYAFYDCSELKSITIPAGITKIHEETFSYCENLIRIKFTGNAPVFETNAWGGVFNSVTAFAYYPAGNATWTEDVRQNYGGTISWVAYEPAVATVNGTEYSSLEDAFSAAESGDVVQLNRDAEVGDVVLRRGVGLDLNGHELAADYVFAVKGAEIADNSEGNTGLLKVDAKHVMISKENAQLPVWNGEGYVFTTVTYKTRLMEHDNDKLKFAFLPQFKSGATALLEDGVDGNKVTIEVRVSWLTKMGREYRNLVFNEQQVDTVVGTNGAFILTFSGFSQLDMASGITVEGIVISETGVSVASTPIVVDVGKT